MKRRYRLPAPKVGVLDVRWGKTDPFSDFSLCYTYGNRDGKCDCRVLSNAMEGSSDGKNSLAQELKARGYDITTLRFSIRMKEAGK